MASMLEGGGKTPILPAARLEAMGFSLCAYPLSLLGVSVRAMEGALEGLKGGQVPQPPAMPTFQVCVCVCPVLPACWEGRRAGAGGQCGCLLVLSKSSTLALQPTTCTRGLSLLRARLPACVPACLPAGAASRCWISRVLCRGSPLCSAWQQQK